MLLIDTNKGNKPVEESSKGQDENNPENTSKSKTENPGTNDPKNQEEVPGEGNNEVLPGNEKPTIEPPPVIPNAPNPRYDAQFNMISETVTKLNEIVIKLDGLVPAL